MAVPFAPKPISVRRVVKPAAEPSPKPSKLSMISADKRKAVFLLHQEGMSLRQISRQLRLSRNAVRRIIAQSGQMPAGSIRRPSLVLDPELLRTFTRSATAMPSE